MSEHAYWYEQGLWEGKSSRDEEVRALREEVERLEEELQPTEEQAEEHDEIQRLQFQHEENLGTIKALRKEVERLENKRGRWIQEELFDQVCSERDCLEEEAGRLREEVVGLEREVGILREKVDTLRRRLGIDTGEENQRTRLIEANDALRAELAQLKKGGS